MNRPPQSASFAANPRAAKPRMWGANSTHAPISTHAQSSQAGPRSATKATPAAARPSPEARLLATAAGTSE